MRYKSLYDYQLRDIIRSVIKYRDMYCICITVPMWSFHDRLLLTVTPNSLTVEQDLITELWYGISVLDCRIWRFCLELINIPFDLSEFMYIWLCWHHLSTCDTSLVSDVITTSKDVLCRLQTYQHMNVTELRVNHWYSSKLASGLGQITEAQRLRLPRG